MFADTSFLCALYRDQDNSAQADALMQKLKAPLRISTLVQFEFHQSARLQAFRFSKDRVQGFSKHEALSVIQIFEKNIDAGGIAIAPVDWPQVHILADQISAHRVMTGGHHSLDVLHIATALHLKEKEFLTFDANQQKLARAEGLKVPL